jgi:hypothetical protein
MGLRDVFTNPAKFIFYGGAGYPTPNVYTGGVNGVEPLLTLKYGKDSPGGGASRQPFIVTPIPGASATFNTNGLVIARSATDVERLAKFFTTTPGLLFIAKQNVLSQTNVRTQASNYSVPQIQPNNGPYLPTNTLAQVGLSVVGSHFYKQGLLPDGYFSPKYTDAVKTDQEVFTNRLYNLYYNKIVGTGLNSIQGLLRPKPVNSVSLLPTEILNYRGGPGSTLGVGSTSIPFALGVRTGINNPLYVYNRNQFYGILPGGANKVIVADPALALEAQLTYQNKTVTQLVDFRARLRDGIANSNILSKSPSYTNESIENRVFLGDPGRRNKNIISYTAGAITNGFGITKAEALDKINAKPLYSSRFVDPEETNDLVKFRIEAINNDDPGEGVFIHFRAFIDSFSDNYNADWSSTQYIGRGEKFYTYNNFDRTINMSWTVVAQSKDELIPMYQKLNFLASNLMPDYNNQGYMRGALVRLTVGGYLYSQPGFITSLTYDIPQEATYEIGINDVGESDPSVKELPHMIKVSTFTFTPIHNFVPRKQINTYGGDNRLVATLVDKETKKETSYYAKNVTTFGDQRFIALAAGAGKENNNYDYIPPTIQPTPAEENQASINAIASLNQLQAGTQLNSITDEPLY